MSVHPNPGEHYKDLTAKFGTPYYTRIDAPATPEQKSSLKKLSPASVTATELAGEPITAKLTRAPSNNADRRPESPLGRRLVCRPSFRNREYIQAILRKPQKRRASECHCRPGTENSDRFSRNWRHNTLNANELYKMANLHYRALKPDASPWHKSQIRRYL